MSISKKVLAEQIAEKHNITKAEAERAISMVVEGIQTNVVEGNSVILLGFGTFEQRSRAARQGRNPQTGQAIQIAASNSPAFKPAKAFKDSVNK